MQIENLTAMTVVAWAVAGVWIVVIVVFFRACRRQSWLQPVTSRQQPENAPRLSVVVAARNESDCIETCIRSLFRQDYPNLEVVAVNDRSTDDTPQILDRLANEFPNRLRIVHVSNLPAGWFGKPHALDLGLKSATGTLICFTDADCEFQLPSAMRSTVAELLRGDIDLFSIAAKYSMNSLRERVVVPCCTEAVMTWLRPERVNDPRWSDAFANGAFILVRREPFEQIGGWAAVRTQISEDLQVARLAKRSGLRLAVAQAPGFYQTGSYRTARESWDGWSRIFKGTLTPRQLVVTLVRMTILFLLPLTATLWGMSDAILTGSFEWLTGAAGFGLAIAFSLRCVLDVAMFRLVGAPLVAAPLAPLGRLFVMAAITRALCSHAGLVHTHWRGAVFSAGQLVIPGPTKSEPQVP